VLTTNEAWAAKLRRSRNIGDFRAWKDHDAYQTAFARLLRDLRGSAVGLRSALRLGQVGADRDVGARTRPAQPGVLILAHRRELLEQNVGALLRLGSAADVGTCPASLRSNRLDAAIVVGGTATIVRRLSKLGHVNAVLLEHDKSAARWYAGKAWSRLSRTPAAAPPATARDAYHSFTGGKLREPQPLRVERDGQWWRVVEVGR
jgi:hypothetical protein